MSESERRSAPAGPRDVALECLLAVERDGAYANLVMPRLLREARLDGRDAGLATELAYGTTRMHGLYDAILREATGRPVADLDDVTRAALRLGVHQHMVLGTPPHAVVNETVELVRRHRGAGASRLANAAMRRVTERSADEWKDAVGADLATRASHPGWIVRQLRRALRAEGREEQIEDLLDAHNTPAPLTLAVRPGLADRDAVAEATGGTPTALSPYGVVLPGGDPSGIGAVRDGTAGVQDEGSQLAAAALAAARDVVAGERWLDVCAGPGGKTALLGALAAQGGATVVATELHPHRAELVRDNVRALPEGTVSVHATDALQWRGTYDRILLDAPCTGLGALRRRPESRWRRSPGDLADLTRLQRDLLGHAASELAPGGILAYVTCSPVLAETVAVLDAAGLELLDTPAVLASVTGVPAETFGQALHAQLWPHVHGTDAMFIQLMKAPGRAPAVK